MWHINDEAISSYMIDKSDALSACTELAEVCRRGKNLYAACLAGRQGAKVKTRNNKTLNPST